MNLKTFAFLSGYMSKSAASEQETLDAAMASAMPGGLPNTARDADLDAAIKGTAAQGSAAADAATVQNAAKSAGLSGVSPVGDLSNVDLSAAAQSIMAGQKQPDAAANLNAQAQSNLFGKPGLMDQVLASWHSLDPNVQKAIIGAGAAALIGGGAYGASKLMGGKKEKKAIS